MTEKADEAAGTSESRSQPRYVVRDTVNGYFGSIDVRIVDVSPSGAQIEHLEGLKPQSRGRIGIRTGDYAAACSGVIVWSRLSVKPDSKGRLLYRSGVKLNDGSFADAIEYLNRMNKIVADAESLEKKRQKLAAKSQTRYDSIVKILKPRQQIPGDQMLLVEQARERLRTNPEEAKKWYNRAKYSMASETGQEVNLSYREEVFAIWEYLDRTVDRAMIAAIFDLKQQ